MNIPIKLLNVPWTFSRQDLVKFLSQTLNTRVKFCKVIYDKQTGLSRGICRVQLVSERTTRDLLKRGAMDIEGRTVLVTRAERDALPKSES